MNNLEKEKLISEVVDIIKRKNSKKKPVVVVCVGNDQVVGDCVGPLVGSKLEKEGLQVIGTLDEIFDSSRVIKLNDKFVITVGSYVSHGIGNKGVIRVSGRPCHSWSQDNTSATMFGNMSLLINIADLDYNLYDTSEDKDKELLKAIEDIHLKDVIEYSEIMSDIIISALKEINNV